MYYVMDQKYEHRDLTQNECRLKVKFNEIYLYIQDVYSYVKMKQISLVFIYLLCNSMTFLLTRT